MRLSTLAFIGLTVSSMTSLAWCQQPATKMITQTPKMKMTTSIPESITTPDKVETPIGKLDFFDDIFGSFSYRDLQILGE